MSDAPASPEPSAGAASQGARPGAAAAFALATGVTALIVWASLFRDPSLGEPAIPHLDKVKHAAAYSVFALAWARAMALSGRAPGVASLASVVLGAVQGGAIELLQPRFGRTCDLLDEAANVAGAVLGALAWRRFLALALVAGCAGALVAGGGCASSSGGSSGAPAGARTVTVNTVPGRSAGIDPAEQAKAERELASRRADGPSAPESAGGPTGPGSPTSGAIPLPPDEDARLLEQAKVRRMSGDALARDFYDALLARVPTRDRPFFRWLRARLEPSRDARRAAIGRAVGFTVRLHGALLDLGDMAFEEGRNAEARSLWLEALLAEPASPRALARRAFFESGAAGVHASLEAVKAYEAKGGELADPFVARCHERTSREARGEALLVAAEEQGMSPAIAARFLGERRLASNDHVGASKAFERALLRAPPALVPQGPYARATLARILRLSAEGNPVAAEELSLAAAQREGPGAPPVFRYASAIAALASGDGATAAERARDAAQRDLPGAPLGRLVAELLLRAGRPDAARLLLSPGAPSR